MGKKRLYVAALALFACVITGCISDYSYYTPREEDYERCGFLKNTDPLYIARAANWHPDERYYAGTGRAVSRMMQEELALYALHVDMGQHPRSFKDALRAAKHSGAMYLIYPSIIRWNAPVPTVNLLATTTEVKIAVFSVAKGTLVDEIIIKASQPRISQYLEPTRLRMEDAYDRIIARWYHCTQTRLRPNRTENEDMPTTGELTRGNYHHPYQATGPVPAVTLAPRSTLNDASTKTQAPPSKEAASDEKGVMTIDPDKEGESSKGAALTNDQWKQK